jgi:large subunit ribosomal protein L9
VQIILLENVMNLGKIGDLVKVKNGYGRNFLLKQGKALRASKENIDLVNKKKVELNKKNEEIKSQFKLIANKISNKTLKLNKEAKEKGELYGSIKPKEVSTTFMNDLKVDVNPSQIDLRQEIKKIGNYKININLHSEVKVNINLQINKIDAV